MNQWLLIRKLRGPAFLLLVGITALLNQWDILSFGRSWPLYLILAGLLKLAERAALANANVDAYDPLSGQPQPPDSTIYRGPGTSIIPSTSSTAAGTDPGAGRV